MSEISYDFIDIEIPDFNPEFFDLWLSKVGKEYDVKLKDIAYIFCTDNYLLEVNKTYLDHDYYTDIITFNYNEGDSLSGDLFISYDRIQENAIKYGKGNVFDELCRVMAHGLLHLIGYNDKTKDEAKEMERNEDLCLNLRKSFT